MTKFGGGREEMVQLLRDSCAFGTSGNVQGPVRDPKLVRRTWRERIREEAIQEAALSRQS